jgi:ZIP family zinc transporter
MENPNILIALGLTLFAGLSTGIGSTIAFFSKTTNTKFLSIALGISAGVMIYVSFVEILDEANHSLVMSLGKYGGHWLAAGAFFGGMFFTGLVDQLVPSYENPHEYKKVENIQSKVSQKRLLRMGVLSAFAIAFHNLPEGLATFIAALKDPSLGIPIAVAIAIHNIPEGIAVSVPIYYATKSKRKAFLYSFLSGLAEPLGAIIGYSILLPFINDVVFGILFAVVAGIMVYISLDELLPAAREYGEAHLSILGLFVGMIIMAVSLLMFI